MGSPPFGNIFGHDNFPPTEDPSNRETGVSELYPERLQDEINECYTHDKVLPRRSGVDYEADKELDESYSPETQDTPTGIR